VAKNVQGCRVAPCTADHGRLPSWIRLVVGRLASLAAFALFANPAHSLTDRVHRRLVSQLLLVVKKTTGGRAWLPKWGFSGLTKGQKVNKKQQRVDEQTVVKVLREAEQSEIQHTTKQQAAR